MQYCKIDIYTVITVLAEIKKIVQETFMNGKSMIFYPFLSIFTFVGKKLPTP